MADNSSHKRLYLWVLGAIVLGVGLGLVKPEWGVAAKPLGDFFLRLIKLLVGPLVFLTVVSGIASVGDLKKVGRIGLVALIYFELMTTLALVIGMAVAHLVGPGRGMHIRVDELDPEAARQAEAAVGQASHSLMDLLPHTMVGPFVSGDILQILVVAILVGIALAGLGETGAPLLRGVGVLSQLVFRMVAMIMRLAPIGAFGAMAYTVGKHGLRSLANLGELLAAFYATSLLFVFVVLGVVCRLIGLRLWPLLRYIKDELVIVLGTSSSESVLPRLMDKLESLGCAPPVVRLVVPTGYSFNLDGTSIYLTMAALFVAQATDTDLTLGQEIMLLLVLLVTSKGAAAVTGGGFVTLTSTLASTRTVPVAGASVLLGVDRFMSEARALTNCVGNTVATLVVARYEKALDMPRALAVLEGKAPPTDAPTPSESAEP